MAFKDLKLGNIAFAAALAGVRDTVFQNMASQAQDYQLAKAEHEAQKRAELGMTTTDELWLENRLADLWGITVDDIERIKSIVAERDE